MKRMKLITNALLIALACLTLYFTYTAISSNKTPLTESISLFYTFFLCMNLLSYKFNLQVSGRIAKLDTLNILLVLFFSTLMYFSRTFVDSLWHFTICLFIFQSGRLLYRVIPAHTALSITSRWAIVLTVSLMEYLIIFEKSTPFIFLTTSIVLAILSVIILLGFVLKPTATY